MKDSLIKILMTFQGDKMSNDLVNLDLNLASTETRIVTFDKLKSNFVRYKLFVSHFTQ